MGKLFECEEYTAPSHWAPYLFNGDSSGISDEDAKQADRFIERIGLGSPTGCSKEPDFVPFPDSGGLGADCLVYQFLREIE